MALMLVAWAAGPVAACCLPISQPAEHQEASCRKMGPQCGDQMQASHSCCTKLVKHEQSLASRVHELRPELATVQLVAGAGSPSPLGTAISLGWVTSPSPPGPAPGATNILSI